MRRRDRHLVGPPAQAQQLAGQCSGRNPAPTAASPPTSERTIEWQNASACTVSSISSPDRTTSSRCSDRIVLAPSRRRQNAAKSCRPTNCSAARAHRGVVQRTRPAHRVQPAKRVGPGPGVGHPVPVASPQRAEPGIEIPADRSRIGEFARRAAARRPAGAASDRPGPTTHRSARRGGPPARWRERRHRCGRPPPTVGPAPGAPSAAPRSAHPARSVDRVGWPSRRTPCRRS